MKLEEVRKCIIQAFKGNKSITPQQLGYTPYNIPLVQAYGVLKHLVDEGCVTKNDKAHVLIDEKKALSIFGMDSPVDPKPKKASKPKPKTTGRNISRYMFEKVAQSKSQVVLAVIKAYVRDNKNVTYKKLEQVFPPLVKRFGTLNTLAEAKTLSPDSTRPRYFFKEHQIITTSDKKQIVVCNQFIHSQFLEFIVLAKALGYIITAG